MISLSLLDYYNGNTDSEAIMQVGLMIVLLMQAY